jgi:precorrin-2/cobalt-factor-2 C20-methyltransferase
MDVKTGTFYGLGVGPGDPELLTVKAAAVLSGCAHVFVPKARISAESVALEIARRYLRPGAEVRELVFPMTPDQEELEQRWRESAEAIAPVLRAGSDVCFLTLGDPLVYSTYIYLVRALEQQLPGLKAVTVPGITSFCAAASATQFALGEGKELITIVPTSDDLDVLRRALTSNGTVVLMKIGKRLREILRILEETGLIDHSVFVSHAGLARERIELDLRKLCADDPEAGYLSVIIVHASRRSTQ